MDEKQKKQYVKNSLKFDSALRIEEVLKRYWKLNSGENLKKIEPKDDIIQAKEVGLI